MVFIIFFQYLLSSISLPATCNPKSQQLWDCGFLGNKSIRLICRGLASLKQTNPKKCWRLQMMWRAGSKGTREGAEVTLTELQIHLCPGQPPQRAACIGVSAFWDGQQYTVHCFLHPALLTWCCPRSSLTHHSCVVSHGVDAGGLLHQLAPFAENLGCYNHWLLQCKSCYNEQTWELLLIFLCVCVF